MNSFMSWVGGKKALREEVVRRFPLYYERYIEVFGGGGWVLFHKNPGNDFEVYNDFNGLLTNLYRCVREKPDLLMGSLRYVLNAREDFDRARLALRRKRTTSVQRAAWFYQIIRQSYASALTSFGNQPHDLWADFPLIEQAHRRLARVVIEGTGDKDYELFQGKLLENSTPILLLTDSMSGSAGESIVTYCRTLDNCLVIGGPTRGAQLVGNVRGWTLPNSGIGFQFGQSFHFIYNMENVEGKGYAPDLWCNPKTSLQSVLNMVERYDLGSAEGVAALRAQLPNILTK